jgi:diphthine-ammonia ligase
MDLPLFTRDIKGKAVSRGPEYGSRHTSGEGSEVTGDETEDLYILLKKIKVCEIFSYERDSAEG